LDIQLNFVLQTSLSFRQNDIIQVITQLESG
jgi:hypothetical protein